MIPEVGKMLRFNMVTCGAHMSPLTSVITSVLREERHRPASPPPLPGGVLVHFHVVICGL